MILAESDPLTWKAARMCTLSEALVPFGVGGGPFTDATCMCSFLSPEVCADGFLSFSYYFGSGVSSFFFDSCYFLLYIVHVP